jgi:hypothetical protein
MGLATRRRLRRRRLPDQHRLRGHSAGFGLLDGEIPYRPAGLAPTVIPICIVTKTFVQGIPVSGPAAKSYGHWYFQEREASRDRQKTDRTTNNVSIGPAKSVQHVAIKVQDRPRAGSQSLEFRRFIKHPQVELI